MSTEVTTIVEPGMVVRYVQVGNGVLVRGLITGIIRHNLRPWLKVVRVKDGATVVVGLNEVREVLSVLPVVDVPEVIEAVSKEVPVTDVAMPAPWVLEAPQMPRSPHAQAHIGDTVRFLSPDDLVDVGIVQEIDESGALVENRLGDLVAIEPPDILALLAA